MLNEIGKAITELNPVGDVKIHGEIWSAESLEGQIAPGTSIIVKEVSNLKLKVKRVE